jgi:hypothetical protein
MPTFQFGETVTVFRRVVSGRDQYGNDVYTDVSTTYPRIPVWQGGSTEDTQGQDMVTTSKTMLLPVGAGAAPIDHIMINGDDYEVIGEPEAPVSPWSGTAPGIVVQMRRVTG